MIGLLSDRAPNSIPCTADPKEKSDNTRGVDEHSVYTTSQSGSFELECSVLENDPLLIYIRCDACIVFASAASAYLSLPAG